MLMILKEIRCNVLIFRLRPRFLLKEAFKQITRHFVGLFSLKNIRVLVLTLPFLGQCLENVTGNLNVLGEIIITSNTRL